LNTSFQNLTYSLTFIREGKPDGNARPHSEQSAENRRKNKLAIRAHSNTAEAQQAANTVDLTHFGNDEAFTNLIAAINPDYKTINATATYDTAVGSFEMLDLAEPTTPEQQVNVNTAATPDHLNIGTVTTPESMDPSQLGACGYVNNISPWTVQQTARLTIDPGVGPVQGERRFLPLDTGADYIRTNLNKIFTEVRAGSVITDAQILGTAQSYLKAFAQGELASPATPTCGAFFVTGDNVPAATSNAGEFSFA